MQYVNGIRIIFVALKLHLISLESGFGVRHWQMLLIFCGLTVGFTMRVNLSVAVVAMTNATTINPDFPVSEPQKFPTKVQFL